MIGRSKEIQRLIRLCAEPKAQFLALYGRRRIGKTYLIKEFFKDKAALFISVTGQKGLPKKAQIEGFQQQLEQVFYSGKRLPQFKNWNDAFQQLTVSIQEASERGAAQIVVFLDELPWLATPRSDLLSAIDHFWNTQMQYIPGLRLIVCGSAASWMLRNVIHAKGGLHNRITASIRLLPLSINEVGELLKSKQINLTASELLQTYMILGGVPYYLSLMQGSLSVAQNIGTLCFGDGELRYELTYLFKALFSDADEYIRIIRILSSRKHGLTHGELSNKMKRIPGGLLTERLQELTAAGFVESFPQLDNRRKGVSHRIIDEFVLFSLRWIEDSPRGTLAPPGLDQLLQILRSPSFAVWAGYAFENFCFKHHGRITKILGIGGINLKLFPWRLFGTKEEEGAQIDLLIDRSDGIINLCEIKYCEDPFVADRAFAEALKRKRAIFAKKTGTKKRILFVLITNHPIKENEYSRELFSQVITAQEIIDQPS